MIENPLLGPKTEEYKATPRTMPKAYSQWLNAEIMSDKASDQFEKLERFVSPLSKVTNRTALDNVWKQIRLVSIIEHPDNDMVAKSILYSF